LTFFDNNDIVCSLRRTLVLAAVLCANFAILQKIIMRGCKKMQELKVCLSTIEQVKAFCDICNEHDFEIDLFSGKYIVNAKSIMGILSLDLSRQVCMKAFCSGDDEFMSQISEYVTA